MKKIYLRLPLLIGISFAILCGCQKEEMPTNSEFTSISRLESEKMFEKWNMERKNKLKSSFSLKIAEEQWRRAKFYLNKDEDLSFISVPITNRVAICFGRKKNQTEISFCETRPDKNYLEKNNGKVFFKTLTGHLIFYNKDGKGLNALRYVNGKYDGIYEVIPKKTMLKGLFDMNFTEEVVFTGRRINRDPEFTIVQNEDLINERQGYDPRYERVCVDDGGGSTGGSEPEEPKEPKTKNQRPVNETEKLKIQRAKEEVKNRGCGANMAYNMVANQWGEYSFAIDPSIKGAGYNPSTNTFSFKNTDFINADVLTEEIMHAAQNLAYTNGTYQYKDGGNPNIEFEAKMLSQINTLVKGICCFGSQLYIQELDMIRFQDDLKGWINSGIVNQDQFIAWVNKWRNHPDNPYKNIGSVRPDLKPELLSKFIKEYSGCIKTQF